MKKHVLNSSEPESLGLIGITTPVKDYRISWLINQQLGFDLIRAADVLLPKTKNESAQPGLFDENTAANGGNEGFSCYEYEIEENRQSFFLVSNRNDFRFFIPELNKTDYFLVIQGPISASEIVEIQKGISAIQDVLTASVVDSAKLKSKNNLFF